MEEPEHAVHVAEVGVRQVRAPLVVGGPVHVEGHDRRVRGLPARALGVPDLAGDALGLRGGVRDAGVRARGLHAGVVGVDRPVGHALALVGVAALVEAAAGVARAAPGLAHAGAVAVRPAVLREVVHVELVHGPDARVLVLGAPLRDPVALRRVLARAKGAARVAEAAEVRADAADPVAGAPAVLAPLLHRGVRLHLPRDVHRGDAGVAVLGAKVRDALALRGVLRGAEAAASVAHAAELRAIARAVARLPAVIAPLQDGGLVGLRRRLEGRAHRGHAGVAFLGPEGRDALALRRGVGLAPLAAGVAHAAELLAVAGVVAQPEAVLAPVLDAGGGLQRRQEVEVHGHHARVTVLGAELGDAVALARVVVRLEAAAGVPLAAELLAEASVPAGLPAVLAPVLHGRAVAAQGDHVLGADG
mmetsp:Transcript_47434/g.125184  ORF Transcript_47434/g.125184 Transcript_47434/m.125184 type:complete len:418 (+) Transcript_47434:696-1949(+)